MDRAEGNPLFLEQLVAVGVEDESSALPSSIQAVLAARIDRLDDAERAVLEHASVQGRSFSVDAVAELLPERNRADIAMDVVSLVRKQLVRPDRSAVRGDDAFRFAHVLIREVAYQGLPKGRRAELHERLAGWLAGLTRSPRRHHRLPPERGLREPRDARPGGRPGASRGRRGSRAADGGCRRRTAAR